MHELRIQQWLGRTCRLLGDDRWPVDVPLAFDGSDFRGSSGTSKVKSFVIFFDSISQWRKAKDIKIKNCHLDQEERKSLSDALQLNQSLERLSICNVTSDAGFCISFHHPISKKLNFGSLQQFTLEKSCINKQDISAFKLFLESSSLSTLVLRHMKLDDLIEATAEWLSRNISLVTLDLSNSCMCVEMVQALLCAISENNHLRSLTLSGCRIGHGSSQELNRLLSKNSTIKAMDLSNNDIDETMISYLVNGSLKNNNILETLVLSRNPIGDEGAQSLVELLTVNVTLKSLSLIDCEIWGRGCMALASGLSEMKALRSLYVDGDMEELGGVVLDSLQRNVTLRYLWTDRTALLVDGDRTWRMVEHYLRLNRCKRRALTENSLPLSLYPRILEEVHGNPSLIYHFLRQKPELVELGVIPID